MRVECVRMICFHVMIYLVSTFLSSRVPSVCVCSNRLEIVLNAHAVHLIE